MRMIIATGFVLMLGALGACADTDSTTPEEACLFFFDKFGERLEAERAINHQATNIEMGAPFSQEFGIPRYKKISWRNGIAAYGPVPAPTYRWEHRDNIAFSLVCLVDVVDRRVLRITIERGDRTGDMLPISPDPTDGSARQREAIPVVPSTLTLATTIMRGLY